MHDFLRGVNFHHYRGADSCHEIETGWKNGKRAPREAPVLPLNLEITDYLYRNSSFTPLQESFSVAVLAQHPVIVPKIVPTPVLE